MDLVVIIVGYLTIAFWVACSFYYDHGALRYPGGFAIFAQFKWLITATNLVYIFGWKIGLISFFVICLGGAVLFCGLTTNQIFLRLLKMSPDTVLAIYSVLFWVYAFVSILNFFV